VTSGRLVTPAAALSQRSGRPGASLRPAPLRTGRARFRASGSSKPCGSGGATPYDPLTWSCSSAGPFTTTVVAASNLSVGSGVIVIFACWAHLTASARFRVRAPGPVSGRLCGTASWRSQPSCPGFPSPFGRRRLLLGHPIPAGSWALLAVGLLGTRARTPTGLPRFARTSCDRGGCPLYPEDGGAPPGQVVSLTGACRSTAASPCTPLHIPSCGASLHEASTGVHAIHPSGLPLACGRPDGTGRPWASPGASHPADQEPTTHAEAGTGHRARTWNYALNITSVDPPIV
jgi:hypothetical protein